MNTIINHQFRLARRPVGMVTRADFDYSQAPVVEPGDGEVLVTMLYISLDPAMRGWMNEGRVIRSAGRNRRSHACRCRRPGRRVERHSKFAVGDDVSGTFGVQEYAVVERPGRDQGRPDVAACRSTSARSACRA